VIRVTGPNGYDHTSLAAEPTPYRTLPRESTSHLIYGSVPAPGGAWDFGDNGVYVLHVGFLAPGSSQDQPVMDGVALTQVLTQNLANPRAEVVSSAFGARDWMVAVRYSAASGSTINVGSISDVDVEGVFVGAPQRELAATLFGNPGVNSDGSVTAVYRIQSPSPDGWATTYNLPATLWTRPGEVTDSVGRSVGVGPIAAANPSVNRPILLGLGLRTVSAVVNAWDLELTLSNGGALAGTLTPGSGNLSVYADINGVYQLAPVNVQFVSSSTTADNALAVRYRIVPRQGFLWNGTYTVQLNPQNTFNMDWGLWLSQAFVMQFAGPSVQGLHTVSRSNTTWDVELAFDNPGSLINTSSLSAQNLIVAAPGGRTMRVSLLSFANGSDGVLRARYRIVPVNAGTALAHGMYGFSLRGGSVVAAGVGLPGRFITDITI
jgi:hypothetical protein